MFCHPLEIHDNVGLVSDHPGIMAGGDEFLQAYVKGIDRDILQRVGVLPVPPTSPG
jgi:hypothetical protein